VTGVENDSPTRSGRGSGHLRAAGILGSVVVSAVAAVVLPLTGPVAADPLASAKAQAAQITQQLQAEGAQLDVLSEQYEQAQLRIEQLDGQLRTTHASIVQTQAQVASALAALRAQALSAYMSGGTDTGLEQLFTSGGEQATVTEEYRQVAGANVSGALDHLHVLESTLSQQQGQLQSTEQGADAVLGQADAARRAAQEVVAGQQATLTQVKGQIAAFVAQQQAAQAAAQAAAFQARLNAARTQSAAVTATGVSSGSTAQVPGRSVTPVTPVTAAPPAPGGAGGRALAAAETQIGVPYVWAGDTPGVGFDCSGLTMWAWAQAGVSLSHSAAAQYDETTHIPLSDLEPGDLLFYDEGTGTIGHVTMYVGPGEMIQAEETGTRIQITGIWSSGLVGAGRP
jgi:cell wall-associated NlpC family hydrolase